MPVLAPGLVDAALTLSTPGALVVAGGPGRMPTTPSTLKYTDGTQTLEVGRIVKVPKLDFGVQGGTIEGPLAQVLLRHQPIDPAFACWELSSIGSWFEGVWDPVLQLGYNPNQVVGDPGRDDETSLYYALEANYFEPPTQKYTAEGYVQFNPPRNAEVQFQRRPWMFTLDKETGSTRFSIELGPAQTDFGYFQVGGGIANGSSFTLLTIVTGEDRPSSQTSILTPLLVAYETTFNSTVDVLRGFSCSSVASDDTYIGTAEYDNVYRLNIGTTVRTGSRHLLLGRNLQGSNSSDYMTSGTSAVAGYAGIEFRDTGDIRFYSVSGATTAGAAVTPTSRLTISASTGVVTAQSSIIANSSGSIPVRIGTTGVPAESGYPGIWFTSATPTLSNYAILSDAGVNTIVNAPSGGFISLRVANASRLNITSSAVSVMQLTPLWFTGDSSTTANRTVAALTPSWVDATDATRRGQLTCSVFDSSGSREAWRSASDGSQVTTTFSGNATFNGTISTRGIQNQNGLIINNTTTTKQFIVSLNDINAQLYTSVGSNIPVSFPINQVCVGQYTAGSVNAQLDVKAKDAATPSFAAYKSDGSVAFVVATSGAIILGSCADSAIPNGGAAWSTDTPGALKVRDLSGVLKTATLV